MYYWWVGERDFYTEYEGSLLGLSAVVDQNRSEEIFLEFDLLCLPTILSLLKMFVLYNPLHDDAYSLVLNETHYFLAGNTTYAFLCRFIPITTCRGADYCDILYPWVASQSRSTADAPFERCMEDFAIACVDHNPTTRDRVFASGNHRFDAGALHNL